MYYSTLPPSTINNPDSKHALRVRLTPNTASLANQKPNPNFNHTNYIKYTPAYASQVYLTQNQLAFAQPFHTLKVNTPNYTNSNHDFASRVHFTHNKLTPAGHNLLIDKQNISHNLNASFAPHNSNYQIESKLVSHSTTTVNTPLQIEPQIALFETPNTGKAPLDYQNQSQFTKLSHVNLSINKTRISTVISTQKSHTLNNSRAQLVNNKKSLFAQTQSEIQLSSLSSIKLIDKSKTSSKMSQQVSSMIGKSASN